MLQIEMPVLAPMPSVLPHNPESVALYKIEDMIRSFAESYSHLLVRDMRKTAILATQSRAVGEFSRTFRLAFEDLLHEYGERKPGLENSTYTYPYQYSGIPRKEIGLSVVQYTFNQLAESYSELFQQHGRSLQEFLEHNSYLLAQMLGDFREQQILKQTEVIPATSEWAAEAYAQILQEMYSAFKEKGCALKLADGGCMYITAESLEADEDFITVYNRLSDTVRDEIRDRAIANMLESEELMDIENIVQDPRWVQMHTL